MTGHPSGSPPLVSIVVIGRNEGERLRRCLQAIQALNSALNSASGAPPPYRIELIYVDSASTDASVALATSFGASVVALRPDHPTAALARNAGWTLSHGDFVLFLDGDTVLAPSFLAHALPEFAASKVAVVWGHRRELHPIHSIYNRVLDLDWIYPPGVVEFCGGDALFRREALAVAGGFDDTLIAGEEPELCRRIRSLGWTILHIDHPMTGHDLAITRFAQYWRRATRAGHAYAEVSDRFRATATPFWEDQVRGNRNRALTLMVAAATGVIASALLHSLWPAALVVALFSILVARTAWKARWKPAPRTTLILYALHSHLQQIPIFVGQRNFHRNRRRGLRVALVEYKQS